MLAPWLTGRIHPVLWVRLWVQFLHPLFYAHQHITVLVVASDCPIPGPKPVIGKHQVSCEQLGFSPAQTVTHGTPGESGTLQPLIWSEAHVCVCIRMHATVWMCMHLSLSRRLRVCMYIHAHCQPSVGDLYVFMYVVVCVSIDVCACEVCTWWFACV